MTHLQPTLPHISAAASMLAAIPHAWPPLPEPDLSGLGWYSCANEAREKSGGHADELVAALLRDVLREAHAKIVGLAGAAEALRSVPTLRMLREAADAMIDVDADTSLYHLTRIAEEREWICQERGL